MRKHISTAISFAVFAAIGLGGLHVARHLKVDRDWAYTGGLFAVFVGDIASSYVKKLGEQKADSSNESD